MRTPHARHERRLAAAIALTFLLALVAAAPASAERPDAWITVKTKLALLADDDVGGLGMNVDTINGKVTLHGKVPTDAEKARAETVARGIEGVASVRNLLAVVPEAREEQVEESDERLHENLRRAFDADPRLKDSGIKLKSVNDGAVLLAGRADTLNAELWAMQVARGVAGVRSVHSEVRAADRLDEDRPMSGADSLRRGGEESMAGDGTMKGKVDDAGRKLKQEAEKAEREAENMAARAKGKADDTAADLASALGDAWVTSAVKLKLMAVEDVPALDVNVDTNDGVVTLFGSVPTDAAKRKAEMEAREVDGVDEVVNAIEVVPAEKAKVVEAADEDLEEKIESKLAAGRLDDDIEVEVVNGVARLTGSTKRNSDKMRAVTMARAIAGVRAVRSDQVRVNS